MAVDGGSAGACQITGRLSAMHPIQATKAFFRVLIHGEGAAAPPPEDAFQASREPAAQLLALLQDEGRLVDFLMEDIGGYGDADVGSSVRQIHTGCRKVLDERVKLARVRDEEENSTITVEEGFDASSIRLVGNVKSDPPFSGRLAHRGWRIEELTLPTVAAGSDPMVVAPAEIEIQ